MRGLLNENATNIVDNRCIRSDGDDEKQRDKHEGGAGEQSERNRRRFTD